MYTLFPCPVRRHEVTITPLVILELVVGDVVKAVHQIRVGKDVVNHFSRVAVPELIVGAHPLGSRSVWAETIVPCCVQTPWHVLEFDRIDRRMDIFVVDKGSGVTVGNQGCIPEVEEYVGRTI